MHHHHDHQRVPPLLALAFVVVWSTGYIAGPVAVEAFAPLSVLTYRFGLAALLAAAVAYARHGWPSSWRGAGRHAGVGLTLNGLQFGLMYLAFGAGLEPTLGALLHSLSPVMTVLLAGFLLRERVRPVQVAGFVLGVAGVLLVLGPEVEAAGGPVGLVLGALAALCLSLGWLGQRGLSTALPPAWSATVQLAASVPPLLVVGMLTEGVWPVQDTGTFAWSVVWLAVVNSVAGLLLIQALVREGGAGASSSVLFLSPPVTAVMAYVWFGDTLDLRELVGLVVATLGVAVATRVRSPQRVADRHELGL
ncbi:DMT family transporter [Nocardioides marmoribigeumensis]|uniref:Drug/metabolite transporter (DMT)-like permease n=1 Tax=Nocardioides marmoribigeumensis TaxID=433649 RepID=A0ABU2BVC6_9ACTN|nr:DMT family transporter [Nocardioides marmoribigeumensis]MDR7361693.1 drug/metabolite transporter (DMT)-like permease [Nocardioides marmoribigeumensis]